MNEFKKALEQVENGEKVTAYGCESREERHLLALINKNGIEDLPNPITKKEELLQLLAVVVKNSGGGSGSGESINVSQFQRVMEHLSGQKIGYDCSSVNEVLEHINSFYEIAKIIVNATDAATGEAISNITVTVLNASTYKRDDGYYYIPASETVWTMRVTSSGYTMKQTTFVVTEEEAQDGEMIINIEMASNT